MKFDTFREEFDANGLVVLPNVFTDQQLERHTKVVGYARDLYDVKDENGFGDRIGQLHQRYPELMELACNAEILDFLECILQDKPLLFGSLNFEKGTQQAIHVDAIFFWTEPFCSMAGVWIALEDVDMDNGPLMYIPGSHKWKMIRSEELSPNDPVTSEIRRDARHEWFNDAKRAKLVSELGNRWTEKYYDMMQANHAEPKKIALRRGDVVIWHSLLAHGGDVITNKKRSRKSVVYHYIGRKSLLFSFEKFMLLNRNEFTKQNSEKVNIKNYKNIDYISYPYFVTYNQGEQVVHNLES